MAQVISFENFVPLARYDSIPWTQVRIEEAATADADEVDWTAIETIALSPVDSDPSTPVARSFTTELASDPVGLWYRMVFLDATGDDTLPTTPIQNVPANDLYVFPAELKAALNITSTAQDSEVRLACEAASRAIDNHKKTRFYPTTEVRYYSPRRGDCEVVIDDMNSLASLAVDPTGDGTYDQTWTVGTEFVLEPVNAPLEGKPYRTIQIRGLSGKWFPGYPQSVKVTGSFGWAEVPAEVRQAATILASRLYERRNAPFGILAVGVDATAAMHLSRTDPDVASLLDEMDTKPPLLFL